MALSHLIAHHISRPTGSGDAHIQQRESEMGVSGKEEELLRELKHSYIGKAGKAYGQFSEDSAEHPLRQWLQEYLDEKIPFSSFTHKALQHFKLGLEQSECELSAHILFMNESLADGDYLYIFLVDHDEGSYIDANLDIGHSFYLNVTRVLLGAKLNIAEMLSDEGKHYLSVLRSRGDKKLTDFFWDFMGFTDKVDVAADTSEFLSIVSSFTQDLPEEKAVETRVKVVDYCLEQDKAGIPVRMEELSEHVDEEAPKAFASFVAEKQAAPKQELIPDRNQLRQFMRISGRSDLVSMSFAASALGESIVYDAESDSLTIKSIPSSLKARLLKHMQQQ
jgi:nucleoid-associated protein